MKGRFKMIDKSKLSDMMRHYWDVKERHEDCIVFYRLGDFYEMFFEDAVEASKLLDLTLTGRDCGNGQRAPMCGVPYHAAETYIAKLVEQGKKVAICDQLTEPQKGKLVERDVVRIVSAGTLIEETQLDEKKNNYLSCIFKNENKIAIAWADITTGEFFVEEFAGECALEESVGHLVTLSVAEIICNEELLLESKDLKEVRHGFLPKFSCYLPWAFNVKHAEKNLLEQFGAKSLSAYGLSGKEEMISASGALLEYLKETQKRAIVNINSIKVLNRDGFMVLDSTAVRNLELLKNNAENKKYGSLLWVLDKTKTGMGARLLTQMLVSPLRNISEIEYRQAGVEELFNAGVVRVSINEILTDIRDIERLSGKISNGNFNPKDALALGYSLQGIPSLKFQLTGFSSAVLKEVDAGLLDLKDISELLLSAIDPDAPTVMKDGGYIREGFYPELDELKKLRENSETIIDQIVEREKERTGIRTLKKGFNRVFGFYLEVSNSFKEMVPADYIRKQTLTNGERYITEELKILEEKILTSGERAIQLESMLFKQILTVLSENIENLKMAL